MQLNHPKTIPRLWKNGLPCNQSLMLQGWQLLLYRAAVLCTRPSLALGSHRGVRCGKKGLKRSSEDPDRIYGWMNTFYSREPLSLMIHVVKLNDLKRSLSSVVRVYKRSSVSSVRGAERTMVKAWSWGDALSHELMIKWIHKYLKHLCIWMLAWAILCFQWDQEWVLVQQEGGRFEMRMYWFGEKTVFLSVRAPPRQFLTCWKKEIIFPFRIKLFCGTFPGPVLSYPGPLKDRGIRSLDLKPQRVR